MAAGLPSIDASASLSYNLAIMTRIIDFGGTPRLSSSVQSMMTSAGVSASAVVFNAPWLVGVRPQNGLHTRKAGTDADNP
jgi:hypothetical protein